jgi:U6 snRNA-associated Sm-like protein LSm7
MFEEVRPMLTTTTTDDEGNEVTRPLGLVVVRGTLLVVISPVDGSEVIENPFAVKSDD